MIPTGSKKNEKIKKWKNKKPEVSERGGNYLALFYPLPLFPPVFILYVI